MMVHTARNEGYFEAVTSQMQDNLGVDLEQLLEQKRRLNSSLSSTEQKLENLIENLGTTVLKGPAKIRIEKEIQKLTDQRELVAGQIADLDGKIDEVKRYRFNKKNLQEVLSEFETLFDEAENRDKAQILRTVVEEIRVTANRGTKEGVLEFKLRGDGRLKRQWDEVVNKRGVSLTPHIGWLRE